MSYIGNYEVGAVIDWKFSSRTSTGMTALTTAGVTVFKANSTVGSTEGIALTASFNSVTGLNHLRISTTADSTFYATANQFDAVLTVGSVNAVSVAGEVVGRFTLRAQAGLYPTVAGRALDVSAGGEAGLDWANVGGSTSAVNLAGTNIDVDQVVASVSGAVGSVTGAVGSVASGGITAASLAADAITAAKLAADVTTELQSGLATSAALATVDTVVDAIKAVTDALPDAGALTSLATAAALDTIDNFLDTEIAAILADTNELQTDWADGGRLDLIVDAILVDTGTTLDGKIDTIDTNVDSILADTGTDGVVLATGSVSAAAVASDAANEIADALLDRANGIETGLTLRQAHRLEVAAAAGEVSGAETTTVVIRNAVADSKDRITATVDADGNRSAVTTDVT